jgi:anti-sigma B factor antagonist
MLIRMPPASSDRPSNDGPFTFDVSRVRDAAHVRAVGELDMAAAPTLAAEIARLRRDGCKHVCFDLRELTFIDSSGLRFLLETHAEARRDGFSMTVVQGPPAVQRVFELTDTLSALPFVDD